MNMPRFTPLPVVLVLAVVCAGCTSQRQSYPGHDPGVLWTAMMAVADTPDYGGGEDGVAEGNVGGKAVWGGATNPNKSAQQMRSADFVQRKEMVFDLRFKQVRSQGSVYLPV